MATVPSIRGVNPSYFAGMPTVALDPKASKADPRYAQMLSQAMQNRAEMAAKRRENDEDNEFKAIDRKQQALRDIRSNENDKRRSAVLEAGEARLQKGQEFEQDRLKTADTGKLLEALQTAKQNKDDAAVEYFTDELIRRGYKGRSIQETDERFNERMPKPAPPEPPKPPDTSVYGESREDFERNMAAAGPGAPPIPKGLNPPPVARFPDPGEAAATPQMRAAPAGPSPRASASFPPASGAAPPGPAPAPRPGPPAAAAPPRAAAPAGPGWPAPPPPTDDSAFFQAPFDQAGLEAGLDKAMPTDQQTLNAYIAESVRREKAGLPPAPYSPKGLLPGKTLRRRAAESDQMLSPGDPLLNKRVP